jgi:Flp pilus assembly protein TadD
MISVRLKYLLSVLLAASLSLASLSCSGLTAKNRAASAFEEGLALFNAGRYTEALPRFQHATALDPQFGRAYLYLGRSLLNTGQFREALTPLRAAHSLSPEETRRQAGDIMLDILFNNAGRIDAVIGSELLDIFEHDSAQGDQTK